ncbi:MULTISPECIES: hypothetical protein [Pseudomonas]|jgi:hypothetical protein|uniref:Filamentous hemagglutinin n=4 Tax=Pseudomonas chlororaphis TaxID=587753 RepID=A0A0E1ED68_9PSED|nr:MULTISPECIES: hypothetical protein [Pseudomonas]AIC21111.1 filamentous hemagglutinin [Pseudomonas chlororaphis]AIS12221.1 filamentous hemagglutinin [Pseudomonas chlororaphis subsp. aurantiaca]AUG03132.1 hypothetical protein CXQ81_21795 [Pseudomonas sp. 09C 129]AUG42001.1 hypothetical protein CXP47_19655 [Pseudomonas chlororaphis]AVO60030.1 hypothetical protein C6Q18_19405 [Pseudomonas chlororaphis subsp. piscium]
MPKVQIMSVIGSAVPTSLRELGLLACWYLVRDGEPVSGPLTSLTAAQALSQKIEQRVLHA